MIEIRDVFFSYRDNQIFDKLYCEFNTGGLYSIIGPNGSGKTTLLKLISGFLVPDSGDILIDGVKIKDMSRIELAKKVAVLPQEKNKVAVSVYDIIASGRYPYHGTFGRINSDDRKIIETSALNAGVSDYIENDIRFLSGGERQRVYIASVLARNAPYILLDEPTTYLDISGKFSIMSLLKKISTQGKGIITVMHDLSLAMKFSDKLLILNGKNCGVEFLTPENAFKSCIMQNVFDIGCHKTVIDGKPEYIITEK